MRTPIALGLLIIPSITLLAAGLVTSARSQAAAPAEYLPSVSDLMIETIAPRHERLWRAQGQHNWEFAAYELHNLHGAFERLGHAHPTVEKISLPEMIASVTDQPFAHGAVVIGEPDGTSSDLKAITSARP